MNYQIYNYVRYIRSVLRKYVIFSDFIPVSPVFTQNLFPLDLLH